MTSDDLQDAEEIIMEARSDILDMAGQVLVCSKALGSLLDGNVVSTHSIVRACENLLDECHDQLRDTENLLSTI